MSNKELEFIKKKGLIEEFEEFKKQPKWDIRFTPSISGKPMLCLFKNNERYHILSFTKFNIDDFKGLVYKIADCLNCIATEKHIIENIRPLWQMCYHTLNKEWLMYSSSSCIDSSFIIKSESKAEIIQDILNNSQDLKEWMEVE